MNKKINILKMIREEIANAVSKKRQYFQDGADFYDDDTGKIIAKYPQFVKGDFDVNGAQKANQQFLKDHPEYNENSSGLQQENKMSEGETSSPFHEIDFKDMDYDQKKIARDFMNKHPNTVRYSCIKNYGDLKKGMTAKIQGLPFELVHSYTGKDPANPRQQASFSDSKLAVYITFVGFDANRVQAELAHAIDLDKFDEHLQRINSNKNF